MTSQCGMLSIDNSVTHENTSECMAHTGLRMDLEQTFILHMKYTLMYSYDKHLQ